MEKTFLFEGGRMGVERMSVKYFHFEYEFALKFLLLSDSMNCRLGLAIIFQCIDGSGELKSPARGYPP